jgi:hypothetical protein
VHGIACTSIDFFFKKKFCGIRTPIKVRHLNLFSWLEPNKALFKCLYHWKTINCSQTFSIILLSINTSLFSKLSSVIHASHTLLCHKIVICPSELFLRRRQEWIKGKNGSLFWQSNRTNGLSSCWIKATGTKIREQISDTDQLNRQKHTINR